MLQLRQRSDAARILRLEEEVDALRAEVLQARRVLDSATEHAIVTLNLGGRIVGWNAGASSLFGYLPDEVLGLSAEIFFTAGDRARGVFVDELCRALDQGRAVNERVHVRRDGSEFWASGVMLPLRDESAAAIGFLNVFCDRSRQQREGERRILLQGETQHRVRNLLTVVHALASRTLQQFLSDAAAGQATAHRGFTEAFGSQLQALAASLELLGTDTFREAWLHATVAEALSAFGDAGRLSIQGGPDVLLSPDGVAMLGLALHELAVNAIKHGALSRPSGQVMLSWRPCADGRETELLWRETGVPDAGTSGHPGAGFGLLQQGVAGQFGGSVRVAFGPDGLECRITVPHGPAAQ